ncbi:dTDP-4-dehydrorhamnose reductase [Salinimicrobium soli]|uniref:dTDP-4-dehydrorhamnose reductase n=1 Tax=Salinimicrobium soli TaxID=1254399 RepID=UPI003AACC1D0
MKKILVTGASGQLGQCLKHVSHRYQEFEFTFATSEDLDLSQFAVVRAYMARNEFDYCINCAAYTKVEQAEKEQEMAYLINAEAVKNLAQTCHENDCTLVHFSTDYVYDGKKHSAYSEEDETEPLNVYGASKLLGEQYIVEHLEKYFIFRVSWLYSDVGKNFFNTIRSKAEQEEDLKIVASQTGTPTNAYDLAEFVLEIISRGSTDYGTYNYSNLGEASWYDFAAEILKHCEKKGSLEKSEDFPTLATRPEYSVLDKQKAMDTFKVPIPEWKESLKTLF